MPQRHARCRQTTAHCNFILCTKLARAFIYKQTLLAIRKRHTSFVPSSYFCLQVAFGPDGSPSKALLGFCKKNGVQADTVFTEADSKGTGYVWAVVKQPGRATAEVCDESNSVFCNVLVLLLVSTLCMLLLLVFTLCMLLVLVSMLCMLWCLKFVPVPIMVCPSACLVTNPVEAEYDCAYHLLQAQVCAFTLSSSFIHVHKSLQ